MTITPETTNDKETRTVSQQIMVRDYPEFHPMKHNLKDWLTGLDSFSKRRETTALEIIEDYLPPNLMNLFRILPADEKKDWNKVVERLLQFSGHAVDDLQDLYGPPRPGESMIDYAIRKLDIANRNKIDFTKA